MMEERLEWRLLLCFWLATVLPPPLYALSAIYQRSIDGQGRKFGGYRIVPKVCKDSTTNNGKTTGICMFNYECTKQNGTVVGSCMDGFLFGACCKMPDTWKLVEIPMDYADSTDKTSSTKTAAYSSSTLAIHSQAETILLHENGTIANEPFRPDDFEFNNTPELFLASDATTQPPITRHDSHPQKSTTWSTTENYWVTKAKPLKEDNLVQISTLTADNQGNADSINHILSILENPSPESRPDNMLDSSTSSTLSTWVSVDSKPTSASVFLTEPSSTSKGQTSTATYISDTTFFNKTPYTPSQSTIMLNTVPQEYNSPQSYQGVNIISNKTKFQTSQIYKGTTNYHNYPSSPVYSTNLGHLQSSHSVTPIYTNSHTTPKPYFPSSMFPSSTYDSSPSTMGYYTTPTSAYIPMKQQTTYTKRPPSTIYYSTYNKPTYFSTNKPTTATTYVQGPSFHVSLTQKPTVSSLPEPPPTVIVLGPLQTKKPAQSPRPPVGTIITVNTEGQIVTYKPGGSSLKPINHTPALVLNPEATSHTTSTYYKPLHSYTNPTQIIKDHFGNSTEVLVAFPPVRDPYANHSAEGKPEVVSWYTPSTPVYEESTVNLIEDEKLDNKVHKFVEKIVQSLQGNFEDLEHVLIDGQSTPNVTVSQYPQPVRRPTTTKKPPKLPTKKPSYVTTSKPKPTIPLITRPPTRPSTILSPHPTKKPQSSTTIFLGDTSQFLSPSSTEYYTSIPSSAYFPAEVDYRRECGVRPLLKNGRIVGGKGSSFGEWPWQVLVREATWLGLFTKNKCGGVLITSRYVITAAHCQPGFLASLIAVFGEYDISGELESKRSVSRPVKRVIVHRHYNANTFENDIALLELDNQIQFDQHIVPICMPKDDEDFTGRMATVTGWGRLKYGGGVPSVLQEVQVPVMDNSVCQEMFHTAGHAKTILSSFICAGYANGQRDSCEGDSGGPLMVERADGHWTLAGTVSHGIKCAAPYLPGVYMRTTYYKPWLQTITGVKDY